MVLANAMYLSAGWYTPFDESATAPEIFHSPAGDVSVPTMHLTQNLPLSDIGGARLLKLPYREDGLAMVLILPSARNGLAALEARMSIAQIAALSDRASSRRVSLSLPRFRVTGGTLPLRDTLRALGMTRAFEPATADFTAISNPANAGERLFIENAYHQVFIDVCERGTEAAAATVVVAAERTMSPNQEEPVNFTVDRPFMWLIRDERSGAVLFMGRVTDPR
jgi:serpin B